MKLLLLVGAVFMLAAGTAAASGHGGGGRGGGGGHARGGGGFAVRSSGSRGFSGGARAGGFGHVASHGGGQAVARASRASGGASFFPHTTQQTRGLSVTRGSTARRVSGDVPPNYSKPGALIRTEGQLPTYTATNDATTHAVDGGGFIGQTVGGAPAPRAGGTGISQNAPRVASNAPAFDPSF